MLAVVKLLRRSSVSGLLASPAHLEKAAWSGLERFYTSSSSSSSDEEEDESAGPSGRRDAEWEARDARAQAQTMALLSAAMDDVEGEESQAVVEVWEEDQKSLRDGVVGSPNVGKSTLTNYLVRSKVSAVSRKTNTTHEEHMGILTKGDSQLLAVPNVTDTQCGRTTSVPGSKSVTRPVLGEDVPKIRQPSVFRRTQLLEALVPRIGHVHYSSGSSAAREEVVIAMGSNVGDRIANFNRALELMRAAGIQVIRHASLYESAPAYVTNQPFFLNSAVSALTNLDPHSLLKTLKDIESELGRTFGGIRYGPRPLDLDIIFYGDRTVTTEILEIPHARFLERPFVLAPLADLLNESNSGSASHWSNHKCCDGGVGLAWEKMGGEPCIGKEDLRRVIPIGDELLDWSAKTYVMGILNVTPDSFSDGGRFLAVENAAAHARSMVDEGVDFIDIGAQSTRPGATRLSTEEELSRLVPVLEALIADPALKGVKLSVDTFDARVGREAVNMGVHVINDVSGGYLDPEMLPTVADLRVPYIMMHMRGDPTNMQSKANTSYNNVCEEVGQELNAQVRKAEALGVPAWRIITDPGVGFAKTGEQNLNLLKDLPIVRRVLSQSSFTVSRGPMLVGPSRKGFLGKITGREKGEDRDAATVAASVVSVLGGANIIRTHNVRAVRDAMKVVDAIYKESSSRAPILA